MKRAMAYFVFFKSIHRIMGNMFEILYYAMGEGTHAMLCITLFKINYHRISMMILK